MLQQQLLQQTRQKEQASLRDLFLINRKITRVKGDLNFNQQRLYKHNQSLLQTHSELQKTMDEYQSRQLLFSRRICEIYKSQDLGYLALFFSNRSFSDLIDNSYYYRKIIENDLLNMQRLISLKRDITQKESVLEYQKRIIEQTHKSIQQQKQLYELRAHQQQNIYTSLRDQRKEYERKVEEVPVIISGRPEGLLLLITATAGTRFLGLFVFIPALILLQIRVHRSKLQTQE
jgi:peptidoglycan hydrolase CwlO-like protein